MCVCVWQPPKLFVEFVASEFVMSSGVAWRGVLEVDVVVVERDL